MFFFIILAPGNLLFLAHTCTHACMNAQKEKETKLILPGWTASSRTLQRRDYRDSDEESKAERSGMDAANPKHRTNLKVGKDADDDQLS